MATDLLVYGSGSPYFLHPVSPTAHAWLADHIEPEAQQLGDAIAVEHRYIRDIVLGARADGLEVR